MPLGFQHRKGYGARLSAYSTPAYPYTPFSGSWEPAISAESVYTYRSGRNAKHLDEGPSYEAAVRSGRSLFDSLLARKQYLEDAIRDNLYPSTGSDTVFSTTDSGHPFASFKAAAINSPSHIDLYYNGNLAVSYDGYLQGAQQLPFPDINSPFGAMFGNGLPITTSSSYFGWPLPSVAADTPPSYPRAVDTVLTRAVASRVIASSNPWAPKASLAVTIIELLTGDVPSIVKNLKKYLTDLQSLKRTAGSDWLNVQFGWVPLVNDIKACVEVLYKLHILLHTSNEARRKRNGLYGSWNLNTSSPPPDRGLTHTNPLHPLFDDVRNRTGSVDTTPGWFPGPETEWSRALSITADYRFSARFHRGAVPNSAENGYIDRAVELLGLELTPDVLWQITPWTWLLDWASNLGAISQNLSTLDWSNVLLDYAYLTSCIKVNASISALTPQSWAISSQWVAIPRERFMVLSLSSIEKVREQASPYGFSVSWNGLSPYQLSILAALGMTRGR